MTTETTGIRPASSPMPAFAGNAIVRDAMKNLGRYTGYVDTLGFYCSTFGDVTPNEAMDRYNAAIHEGLPEIAALIRMNYPNVPFSKPKDDNILPRVHRFHPPSPAIKDYYSYIQVFIRDTIYRRVRTMVGFEDFVDTEGHYVLLIYATDLFPKHGQ
jgi:hypothetical protein